ncbi:DUF1414 domain-containing protein [Paraneptunicella aestuarii]|uniref:DUF1414 domain-containing protein n=1 Tax=Paraneptunicella aestuarii TaxID=2831148 RepID=UPI001E33B7B9|nr:DUF1414 domain-containing protein [Paraneptunicella aestuarii]UAA40276.1 DUF1414 domain-containing protein [Paraneptunicella aestuarii]
MPQQSKYSDQQFEALMTDIIAVLERENAGRDLSLMVLGNIITRILQHQVSDADRQEMAQRFTQVLLKSVA